MPVLIYLIWIILNGRITAEILLFGLPAAAAASLILYRAVDYGPEKDRLVWKNLPLIALYVLNLIREILIAAGLVMLACLTPGFRPEPVLVEFRSGLKGKIRNAVLANSITLTPGTYTVFQEGDRFVVHCLVPSFSEGLSDSSFVRLLRRIG